MPFINSDHLPIAKNIRMTLALGLLLSCLLIAVIALTSWQALNSLRQEIENVVEQTEVKTSLVYDMRIAARERNLRIMMMMLREDPFDVDIEWMEFREQGGLFLSAREKFLALELTDDEESLLSEQRELSRYAVTLQYQIYEWLQSGDYTKALQVFNDHLDFQEKVFTVLDKLLAIQKRKNHTNVENARNSQNRALKTVTLLSAAIIIIIFFTTAYIIQRLSQQARHIENEGLKFKALIEGGMDAVLVLDRKQVTDCNVNALRMFAVNSITELNSIGLDYLSRFSDEKEDGDSQGIFSAINHVLVDSTRRYTWEFLDANGRCFPTDVELTGIELQGKHFVQMVIRDVTEREKIQKELRDANENLEHKVQERTEELKELNSKIATIARSAGMAEVASGVLHNVGNVLNSVNVSASILRNQAKSGKAENIQKLAKMFSDNRDNLSDFLEHDEKGKLIIPYIEQLAMQVEKEQEVQVAELDGLSANIEHIKNIISMQQSYAGSMGVIERVQASSVFEDAIKINIDSIKKKSIEIKREYDDDPEIAVDKHKLMQILVNLISNAKHAVENQEKDKKYIVMKLKEKDGKVCFSVEDNGIGIEEKDLGRLFEFGFKKRVGGHGYGLHHSALSAKELNGSLLVESDGPGKGAKFTLKIPIE